MTTDNKKPLEAVEYWIFKGTSNFCCELQYNYETGIDEKRKPDEFYDVVCNKDTIEGGIHVITYSSYSALKAECERLQEFYKNCEGMLFSENEKIADLKAECERLTQKLENTAPTPNHYVKLLNQNAALASENEKLKRALEIESSEPKDRSQEAAHYNWLDEQNAALTLQNADLRAALEYIAGLKLNNTDIYDIADLMSLEAKAVLSKHDKKETKP